MPELLGPTSLVAIIGRNHWSQENVGSLRAVDLLVNGWKGRTFHARFRVAQRSAHRRTVCTLHTFVEGRSLETVRFNENLRNRWNQDQKTKEWN